MTAFDPARALAAARRVLDPVRDVLDERVEGATPPVWSEARGWTGFLLGLDDETLRRCEAEGLAAQLPALPGAPADLVALAHDVNEATRLPALAAAPAPLSRAALRAVGERKRRQLEALLGALGPMADRASRIVDVGAGSGHFTRLAAALFEREVLGIERDRARVAAASARVLADAPARGEARFVEMDATRAPIALLPDDLAVGLHACGALGDGLVLEAARAGSDLALVSCCLQKIPSAARAPISRAAEGFTLRREILGLTNLTSSPRGVEVSIEETIAAREARFGLLLLLRARGVEVAPGEEMRGINRRRSRGGLGVIATLSLASRGLPPPTAAEIAQHEQGARQAYGAARRLSLPRSMLARLVEVAVILDRAAALAEHGQAVKVVTIAERAATPRNVAIFGSRDEERLPGVWGAEPPIVTISS